MIELMFFFLLPHRLTTCTVDIQIIYIILHKMIEIIFFFLLFNIPYRLTKFTVDIQIISKLLSIINSVQISIICLLYILNYISYESLYLGMTCVIVYCLHDIGLHIIYRNIISSSTDYRVMIVHHIIMIFFAYISQYYPLESSIGFLCEISNIPMHTSWIMHNLNYNKYYTSIIAVIAFILFGIFRVVLLTCEFLFTLLYIQKYIYSLLIGIILIMNYYWYFIFYNILKKNINLKKD